ncbi:MAG: tetratricopeptide repeat protein [Lysobacterales bacterium]|jgi:tetratricopeptide (TPR) repeat protein
MPARTVSRAGQSPLPGWESFRDDVLPLIVLAAVTLLAYGNAVHNSFVFDDQFFLDAARASSGGPLDFWHFFTQDVWAAYGFEAGLYRPLFACFIAVQSRIFGDWAAGYHLVNVLLHVIVTLAVYGLLRHLLSLHGHVKPHRSLAAALAAGVFAVHPVNAEVVNSVFNGSEMLVSIGVACGLLWFLKRLEPAPARAWTGLGIVYLLILLCRESGATLPGLAVILIWTYSPGPWQARFRRSIPVLALLIPLGIYFLMRTHALGGTSGTGLTDLSGALPVPTTTVESDITRQYDFGLDRIPRAAQVWLAGLQKIFWPYPLRIYPSWRTVPIWLALAAQALLLAAALWGYLRKHTAALAALGFYYVAWLPASRVIGEVGSAPILAERYLYLPSIGLSILLAVALVLALQKFKPYLVAMPVLLVIVALTLLARNRNEDWSSEVALFEREYAYGQPNLQTLRLVVQAEYLAGNSARAAAICDEHRDQFGYGLLSNRCGIAYESLGRFGDAESAFKAAAKNRKTVAAANQNLGDFYLRRGRRDEAIEHFEEAIEAESSPAMRKFRSAWMLFALYPVDPERRREAQEHLEHALQLQPGLVPALQLQKREKLTD